MDADKLIEQGLNARRESKYIEFKTSFDPSSNEAWCELIKDIIAMFNTGGGVIMIGLNNDGAPSGVAVGPVLEIDPATVTDKINSFTGYQFTEFEIRECHKDGEQVAAIVVIGMSIPLIFQRPGTYPVQDGRQKTAFSKGTVYFRHGAKSEPGNTDDIRRAIKRQIDMVRREWLQGVRKVILAPPGAQVTVLPSDVVQSTSLSATPIRITDDPGAPGYRIVNPDETHPYRQKELLQVVNRRLPRGIKINTFDLLSVRRVHHIQDREDFVYESRYGSPQYSDGFANWLVASYSEDNDFFISARHRHKERGY